MNNTELDVNECIYFRLGYDTVSGRILAVTDDRRAVEVYRKNHYHDKDVRVFTLQELKENCYVRDGWHIEGLPPQRPWWKLNLFS